MRLYHYASVDSWKGIRDGSWQSGGEPGLGANLRVCKDNFEDEGARDGAVFSLLEAEPERWVNNTEFPVAWRYLIGNVGRLLLTFEPTEEIVDKSFVIDWSHKERVLGGHKDDVGKQNRKEASYDERVIAEKAYWASRAPLADYIDSADVISGIVLPEVITMCNVPFSLVEVADYQPNLQNMSPFSREDVEFAIEHFPELEVLSAHIS